MLVIVLECAPPRLVGYCSSWALQVATGVYVANLPKREREAIWATIERWADEDTRALLLWPNPNNEQGLAYRSIGNPRRRIIEREGLLLSTWQPRPNKDLVTNAPTSKASA